MNTALKRFLKTLNHGDSFQVFFDYKIDKRFIVLLNLKENKILVLEENELENENLDLL